MNELNCGCIHVSNKAEFDIVDGYLWMKVNANKWSCNKKKKIMV